MKSFDMTAKRQVYCVLRARLHVTELCRRLFICEDYVQTSRAVDVARDIVTRITADTRLQHAAATASPAHRFVIDREPQSS